MPLTRHWLGGAASFGDRFDGPPQGDKLTQWIGGVFFAAFFAMGGIDLLARQAYGWGMFFEFLAAFLHFHYYWGLTENYLAVSFVGKNAMALGMISCFFHGLYVFLFLT